MGIRAGVRQSVLSVLSVLLTVAATFAVAMLMGAHTPFLSDAAPRMRQERRTGEWQAIYVLGADCPCSARVAKHLAGRARIPGLKERVVFVGNEPEVEQKLVEGGWQERKLAAEDARDLYGAQSAPLLVFVDPAGEIRYSGGFAHRSDFRDGFEEREIWSKLRRGEAVKALPAYGCALQFGCAVGGLKQLGKR